ncbi:amidohydrolase family protein [Parafrigoribacterium mesophilum]
MVTENTLAAEYVLAGGDVIAGDDLALLSPGYVQVRNGRIAAVGGGTPPAGPPVVDTTGMLLIPGLINCHTHIEDAALKELAFGVPNGVNLLFEPDGRRHVRMAQLPREDFIAGMRRAAQQMLATGTVAVADYKTGGVAGVAALREAVDGLPLRCLIFAGHSVFPVQSDEVLAKNREGLSRDQLAEIAATLEVADGFAPVRVNDTTDVALTQIEQLVREHGKMISTHSAASPDYREQSLERTGKTDITRAVELLHPDFVVHMTVATDAEIEEMAAAGIPMVMCARTMASLGRKIPPYAAAIAAGAVVGLGTDNVMMSSPDLLAEVDFLGRSVRSVNADPAVLDARTLLASLTIDGARTLQIDDLLGSLSVGKSASIVAFDMSSANLAFSVNPIASLIERATSADIRAVIVDGRLVQGAL